MFKRAAGLSIIAILILCACSQLRPTSPNNPIEPTASLVIPSETPVPVSEISTGTPALAPTETSTETEGPQVVTPIQTTPTEEIQVAAVNTSTLYRRQVGSPVAMANFIAPEAGCNWLGVGGQAFDIHGNPVTNLVVEVGGTLEGSEVFHLAITGSSTNLGSGGFLINLANHTVASNGTLWILLYNLAGEPLTTKIAFNTYADCTKNFTLVNFVEVSADYIERVKLPLIMK